MTINNTDLKLLKAERMTDTADGGGRMTQVAVVDGATNNVFGPLSDIDPAYGAVRLRKVFLAVQADNNDALYSANLFIANPPADTAVSCVLMDKADWLDQRQDAISFFDDVLASVSQQFYGVSALSSAAALSATEVAVASLTANLVPNGALNLTVPATTVAPPSGQATPTNFYTFNTKDKNINVGSLSLTFQDSASAVQTINNLTAGYAAYLSKWDITVDYALGSVEIIGKVITQGASTATGSALVSNIANASGMVSDFVGYSPFKNYVPPATTQISVGLVLSNSTNVFITFYASSAFVAPYTYVSTNNFNGTTTTPTGFRAELNIMTGRVKITKIDPSKADFDPQAVSIFGNYYAGTTFYQLKPETLTNAYQGVVNLPIANELLGQSIAGLGTDGKVPIFETGSLVTVHNTQTVAAASYANGNTVNFGRVNINAVTVKDSTGVVVPAVGKYTVNNTSGILTWVAVAGISMPVTIEHRIEDTAVCYAIVGNVLKLNKALGHAFAAAGSYVSSVLSCKDIQAACSVVFDQQTWTGVWSDSIIGNPLLANFDLAKYPITVNNIGCQQERWLLLFDTATTFKVIGESVGIVGTGNITTNTAPTNPANGKPYFTLDWHGWGAGWVAGNCLRLNTYAASYPVWLIRSVNIGVLALTTDSFKLIARGNAV